MIMASASEPMMMRTRSPILLFAVLLALLPGCTALLGTDEPGNAGLAEMRSAPVYVETLRDQVSLLGEGLRDVKRYDDPALAAQVLQRPVGVPLRRLVGR